MDGIQDVTILKKIIGFIEDASPLLGSVLGSPFAGVALGLMAHYLHLPIGASNSDILSALNASPDSIEKIKQLEAEHAEALESLANADRASARSREVAVRDHVPEILALAFLCIYALIQCYCVIHEGQGLDVISARVQDILVIIISYYFGSSIKSKN